MDAEFEAWWKGYIADRQEGRAIVEDAFAAGRRCNLDMLCEMTVIALQLRERYKGPVPASTDAVIARAMQIVR